MKFHVINFHGVIYKVKMVWIARQPNHFTCYAYKGCLFVKVTYIKNDVDFRHNTLLSHGMPCMSSWEIKLLLVAKVNGTFD